MMVDETNTTDDATKRDVRPEVGGGVDVDELKDSDFVLSDERKFPIVKPGDVSDAVSSWGRYKGAVTFDEFKQRLIALCKRKGADFVAALPDEWDVRKAEMPGEGGAPSIAVKGDFELDVLGLPFGGPYAGKDSQGQWFDDKTQFHADKFGLPPVVYYHSFGPDGKPASSPVYLGRAVKRWRDQAGEWFRVVLDDTIDLAKRVIDAAKQGTARASSGGIAHLCRYDKDGHIREWPVAELSLFDTGEGRKPANPYAVAVPAMKAVWEQAGIALPENIDEPTSGAREQTHEATDTGAGNAQDVAATDTGNVQAIKTDNVKGTIEMDENQINELVAKGVAAALKAQQDAAKAEAEAKATFDAAVKAEVDKVTAASRRLPGGAPQAPYALKYQAIRRWDSFGIEDLALLITAVNAGLKAGNPLAKPLGPEAYQALAVKIRDDNGKSTVGQYGLKAMGLAFNAEGHPLAAIKSDEIMQYDLASYGDEWARVLYTDNLWYKIRQGTPVLDRMSPYMVELQGAESMSILLEGTDVFWYKVAEAADLPSTEATGWPNATFTSSRMGSGAQTLTLGKLGARVLITGELSASTPIAVISEVRRNMEVSGREMIENVLINGDTETGATTNINDIAGTPTSTDPFLVANGFRKLALVTNTNNKTSLTTLSIEDFATVAALMGTGGVNFFSDPSKCAFILDVNTWVKALALAELKTQDVHNDPTIVTGRLPRIYGAETIMSAEMHKITAGGALIANSNKAQTADGKIDQDTLGDNVAGAVVCVRWDQWRMGYRRQMSFEATRIARADVTELVALAEMGIIYRDTEASAEGYGITL
jgi:hypothetical protein